MTMLITITITTTIIIAEVKKGNNFVVRKKLHLRALPYSAC